MKISLQEAVGKNYADFWNTKKRYRVCKGSRGSKKSKTTALNMIHRLFAYPLANGLCVRRYSNALRDSVYSDLKWAIHRLGLDAYFDCTVSPMQIIRRATGQKILFRGLDDGLKITSISVDHGVYRFILDGTTLIPDPQGAEQTAPYAAAADENGNTVPLNWAKLPLIPLKYNECEIPLLKRVKTLQDGINLVLSDFQNNMQEDARNTILVLQNYDGENLGEFRQNLATYGSVKVREDGGVSTLTVEVNAENYKSILELLKKALIANARGYDAKDDRLSGNPNQMNIQSMYSDIDLDANGMETEFQAAFEELLWFIRQDRSNRGLGEDADLQVVFNRDILINETESITNCAKSVGLLSNETIVEQHPWVTDVELELARLQKEQADALEQAQEYDGAFGQDDGGDGA